MIEQVRQWVEVPDMVAVEPSVAIGTEPLR
jgi:hypothetical protein